MRCTNNKCKKTFTQLSCKHDFKMTQPHSRLISLIHCWGCIKWLKHIRLGSIVQKINQVQFISRFMLICTCDTCTRLHKMISFLSHFPLLWVTGYTDNTINNIKQMTTRFFKTMNTFLSRKTMNHNVLSAGKQFHISDQIHSHITIIRSTIKIMGIVSQYYFTKCSVKLHFLIYWTLFHGDSQHMLSLSFWMQYGIVLLVSLYNIKVCDSTVLP